MKKIEHKMISANGINMHIAELGKGPLVLFIHGFPELWHSWRHQILFMAVHGYRAVAPDLRGYGDTTGAPTNDITKFNILDIVGDLIALLEAIAPGEDKVFVVGHDWGAIIAWHLCLFRPDKVKAVVNLSVVYNPRNPKMDLVQSVRMAYGDDYYISRFLEPGDIEDEFATYGVKEVLKKFYVYRSPSPVLLPKGNAFRDFPDTDVLPTWLTEEDIDYKVSKFEKTGFTGGLNYYRALTQTWELTAPWTAAQVKAPAKFVVGELDFVYYMPGIKDYIHNGGFQKYVPLLQEVVIMKDAGHWINQEKPDEINNHIYDFIKQF